MTVAKQMTNAEIIEDINPELTKTTPVQADTPSMLRRELMVLVAAV